MGKYSNVIGGLPRMAQEATYQDRVNAVKTNMLSVPGFELHAASLVHEYAALRREKDQIAEQLSECNLRLEAVSQLMADQFEAEGVSSLKTDEGRAVSVYLEPYAQVADKEAFRQWCVAEGLERQMALPWQVTNALTKARLLEGEPEPPGVTCWAKTTIRLGGEK